MAENNRTIRLLATIALLAAGMALLSFGMFRSIRVQNLPEKDQEKKTADYKPVLSLSEPTVMLDVTIGGLVRLDSGNIQRTYGGGQKPASLCPT
jgi:hypothetical protein